MWTMAKKKSPTPPAEPRTLTRTVNLSSMSDERIVELMTKLSAMPGIQQVQVTSDPPEPGEEEVDINAYVWNRNPEFPAYLRGIREKAGLSIRQAAPALGISVPYLSRLETGGAAKPPDMRRLFLMADLYGVDRREVLRNAGVKLDPPRDLPLVDRTEEQFARMILDPRLKPPLLDDEVLHFIAPRLKAQLIQWALHLVMQENPRDYLNKILAGGDK
jgi:transcriptional regulator with XRE-family HTH domain